MKRVDEATARLTALLDRIEGAGSDHPGVGHHWCRTVGRIEVAYTRCCNQPIRPSAPVYPCEIEQLIPTDCCDRPYKIWGIDNWRQ